MKSLLANKNYSAYIVLAIWLIYMISSIIVILKPNLELGDFVFSYTDPIPIELGIIDCDCENLYLFDSTRKNLMVYNSEGENIANYDFTFTGSVKVVEISEENEIIKVYYYRIQKFYEVNFDGEVISIQDDSVGYIDDYLEPGSTAGSYTLQNSILFYSVYNNQDLIYRRLSLFPFLVLLALVFFSGMAYSVRQVMNKNVV